MKVRKYNKKLQEFDKNKIEESIKLAATAAKEKIPDFMIKRISQSIETELLDKNTQTIKTDDVSTIVENKLMASSYKNTAWHYITFHYDRQKEHVYNSELIKAFEKKLKLLVNDYSLNNTILYLDLTDKNINKLKLEDKNINYPAVLIYKNGKIISYFDIKKNNYDINLLKEYLIEEGIINND